MRQETRRGSCDPWVKTTPCVLCESRGVWFSTPPSASTLGGGHGRKERSLLDCAFALGSHIPLLPFHLMLCHPQGTSLCCFLQSSQSITLSRWLPHTQSSLFSAFPMAGALICQRNLHFHAEGDFLLPAVTLGPFQMHCEVSSALVNCTHSL